MNAKLNEILQILEKTPGVLVEMLEEAPEKLLKQRRIKDKWSIHEHVCHLPLAQEMLLNRMKRFIQEDNPEFKPYIPDNNSSVKELIEYDMKESLLYFSALRNEFIQLAKDLPDTFWNKKAVHPEYIRYTPYIMYRHAMMHDHLHMYRIEELILTREEFLS